MVGRYPAVRRPATATPRASATSGIASGRSSSTPRTGPRSRRTASRRKTGLDPGGRRAADSSSTPESAPAATRRSWRAGARRWSAVDLTRAVDAAAQNLRRLARPRTWSRPTSSPCPSATRPSTSPTRSACSTTPRIRRRPFGAWRPLVKKGGQLAVYVYQAGGLTRYFSDAFRVVTTRLPRPVVYYGSTAAIPLYFLHRLPVVGRALAGRSCRPIRPSRTGAGGGSTPSTGTPRATSGSIATRRCSAGSGRPGFSDLHVADEPICVRGVKVSSP